MVVHRHLVRLAVVAAALTLAACDTFRGTGSDTPVGPQQITGIALPEGYSLEPSRTVVLGEGDRWTGRVHYTINSSAGDMFDFYRRQMPRFGWTEVQVVRAETSVLTFTSGATGRAATVQITSRTLWGARVDMVVSPTGAQTAPAPTAAPRSDAQQPPPPAVPRGAVSAQPLR